jgi:hypothetical protein
VRERRDSRLEVSGACGLCAAVPPPSTMGTSLWRRLARGMWLGHDGNPWLPSTVCPVFSPGLPFCIGLVMQRCTAEWEMSANGETTRPGLVWDAGHSRRESTVEASWTRHADRCSCERVSVLLHAGPVSTFTYDTSSRDRRSHRGSLTSMESRVVSSLDESPQEPMLIGFAARSVRTILMSGFAFATVTGCARRPPASTHKSFTAVRCTTLRYNGCPR